jgi:hypothetical protein
MKTALTWTVEAANEVSHVTVTACPVGSTGTLAQPPMSPSPLLKSTAPEGGASPALAVTVAIRVTGWFVTGAVGKTLSCVSVSTATAAVAAEIAVVVPALSLAISWTRIVWPMSGALSRYVVLVGALKAGVLSVIAQWIPAVSHRCQW